jgi:hypothetical protein
MFHVFKCVCSVRQITDTDDIQAVELVEKRHVERAVVWTQGNEAVRRVQRPPFVVVVEREVTLPGLEAKTSRRYLQW